MRAQDLGWARVGDCCMVNTPNLGARRLDTDRPGASQKGELTALKLAGGGSAELLGPRLAEGMHRCWVGRDPALGSRGQLAFSPPGVNSPVQRQALVGRPDTLGHHSLQALLGSHYLRALSGRKCSISNGKDNSDTDHFFFDCLNKAPKLGALLTYVTVHIFLPAPEG